MRGRSTCGHTPGSVTILDVWDAGIRRPRFADQPPSPPDGLRHPMQRGQIFELKTTGPGGQRLWAYRYRLDGRGSPRVQRGGYLTADDARSALQQALTAAQRRKGRVRVTLADLAEEYLVQHDGQPET